MTEKTVIQFIFEAMDNVGSSEIANYLKANEYNLRLLERQNLIDAHDSKFLILEQVVNSTGATVTYQSGKDYVKDKFGI